MGKVGLFIGRMLGGGFEQMEPVGRSIVGGQIGDCGELVVKYDMELWADVAGSEVEDEGADPSATRGVTEVDTRTGSWFILGSAYCTLISFR